MTTTTEPNALDVVTSGLQGLKKGDKTLGEVLQLALGVAQATPSDTPPLPENFSLNAEVVQTLKTLVATLNGLTPPERRRELTEGEKEDFTLALQDANEVKKAVTATEDKLKQVFQNHADVRAITEGKVGPETRVNKDGYYVLPDKESMAVSGLAKKVIRSVVEPDPVLTDEALRLLEKKGLISHAEYLGATRQVREPDEAGLVKLIEARPGLLPHLASVAKPKQDPYNKIQLVTNKD